MMDCNCWVSNLDEETQYFTRFGAHNPQCPVFKPSLDPVDAVKDAQQRLEAETN